MDPRSLGIPRGLGALLALGACLALAPSAHAGPAEDEKAATLFRDGRDAVQRGDLAGGCAKFKESLALTRRPGTLLNLAECEEKQGRVAAAAAFVEDALTLLPAGERATFAKGELARLDAKAAKITFKRVPGAPRELTVKIDAATLDLGKIGAPQRFDPGQHVVTVSSAGHADAVTKLALTAGTQLDVELGVGPDAGDAPTAVAPPPSADPDEAKPATPGPTRQTIGVLVGAVGLASLGVGVATGIMTIGKKSDVEANCVGGCNDASRDAASAGKTLSTVSTVTFAVGAVGLGVGAFLFITGRAKPQTATAIAPTALPGGGGLSFARSF